MTETKKIFINQKDICACPALLISASASNQGKTTVVAGLARYYSRRGLRVKIFKTGPDFLDPMILTETAVDPVETLDLWMVGEIECQRKLYTAANTADLILIEGAMGLFDGKPAVADLAERYQLSIVIIMDARGMGQTFGALALGLTKYRPNLKFTGILANQVASLRHSEMIQQGIPAEITYLGAIYRSSEINLPSRHLGLITANEIIDLSQRIDMIADQLEHTKLINLPAPVNFFPAPAPDTIPQLLAGRKIAVARDQAFLFLYSENLDLLKSLGAELVFFSPLFTQEIQADAIYLPGGYPELYLTQLAENLSLKQSLKKHVEKQKVIYAECGGMLYLLNSLTDQAGNAAAMSGILPGNARMGTRLAGLGMQALQTSSGYLRGHSFHYSQLETSLIPIRYGIRQSDGQPGEPYYQYGSVRASYLHLYFPSNPYSAAALFLP